LIFVRGEPDKDWPPTYLMVENQGSRSS